MLAPFTRTIRFTPVFNRVEIKWDGKRLSITGNCYGRGGGQCGDAILAKYPTPAVALLCHYWERWHLNDMRAGLPVQMDYLRAFPPAPKDCDWYTSACEALRAANLYEVDGYKFGHKWIREEVPAHVLEWLRDAKIP